MPLKDHYKTLGVAANASLNEIKKAYRNLAHKYHPDKAPDNSFAAVHFREILEAYQILSNEKTRKFYDEERYFSGLSARKEPEKISGIWLRDQVKKLDVHMRHIDSYRMNHKALHDYMILLLSDAHLSVLKQEANPEISKQIIVGILEASKKMNHRFFPSVAYRLRLAAGTDERLQELIRTETSLRNKKANAEKFLPFLIIAIAFILCIIMYLYSRKSF